ncbi:SOS response-associated peptidase [Thalassotalea euphylliae]|uniref:Abasic site processing protein n=1 Tax=Thalassotalea euphylliae TaxID=1655234 RepID=A0A3E0TVV2_9GAMM|nr:SOS response-associated peptidase [Thalassotalea euphylliae]REL28599.1 SOS response-associated peptidase [Thalassotalea euphylliae]
MCGRLNIIDDPIAQFINDVLGIEFNLETNPDLRPSEDIAAIICPGGQFQQLNATWGIQPEWSNRLLINAQAETVNTKPTFKAAFGHSRCLVPCSGWYEWKAENGKKEKYAFTHANKQPFLMAGILYDLAAPKLVTLTTSPNEKCGEIHQRMPVLIQPAHIDYWFNAQPDELSPLMDAINDDHISIKLA